ncbi:rho guanine nucleotide exchange factor 4 [Cochliomyia hominivorax]
MYTPIKRQCSNAVNEMASPRTPETPLSFSRELRQVLQERNLLTAKTRNKVCSMLAGGTGASPISYSPNTEMDKRRNFRLQAVQEIITSEKTYLQHLETLMEYFVKPLKEQKIIDDSSHTTLFGQIEMIHNLNGEFLRELESDMDNVAKAFLKMAPFFKLYSVYAFDYRNALLVLQQLTSNNAGFRKFLELNESRPEVQRKLNSLMIVPIQRVPRYKLLLEQVLLYTSPADADFKLLKESVKQIESTVSHINSCVEDQEVTQMLINIQNSLVNRSPNIVKPSRKVIKEGVLHKVTRTGTEIKRYCVLMSDIFMYCKIIKDRNPNTIVENSLECCCIFPLKKCKVYELLPGNFKITCQSDGIIFSTQDLQVCRAWVGFIRDAIDLHIQCRKTLRKESSKRTPLRKKDVKHFGDDYMLSPKQKKSDYETIFRNKNRATDSEDEADMDTSFAAKSCFGGSKRKLTPFTTSTMTQSKNNCNKISKINGSKPLKRSATMPLPCNENEEEILRKKSQDWVTPEKRLSKLYKFISNDKMRSTTRSILKKTPQPQSQQKENHLNQTSNNTTSDHDPTYGFASRYSDSKSYFRTQNVDNTIPRAVQREDLLQECVTVEGGGNFRDILFPLRASNGSNKSQTAGTKNVESGENSETENWCLPASLKENFQDFNITTPPQKKRVKFDESLDNLYEHKPQQTSQPFEFQCGHSQTEGGEGNARNSLRERIYDFFANLF